MNSPRGAMGFSLERQRRRRHSHHHQQEKQASSSSTTGNIRNVLFTCPCHGIEFKSQQDLRYHLSGSSISRLGVTNHKEWLESLDGSNSAAAETSAPPPFTSMMNNNNNDSFTSTTILDADPSSASSPSPRSSRMQNQHQRRPPRRLASSRSPSRRIVNNNNNVMHHHHHQKQQQQQSIILHSSSPLMLSSSDSNNKLLSTVDAEIYHGICAKANGGGCHFQAMVQYLVSRCASTAAYTVVSSKMADLRTEFASYCAGGEHGVMTQAELTLFLHESPMSSMFESHHKAMMSGTAASSGMHKALFLDQQAQAGGVDASRYHKYSSIYTSTAHDDDGAFMNNNHNREMTTQGGGGGGGGIGEGGDPSSSSSFASCSPSAITGTGRSTMIAEAERDRLVNEILDQPIQCLRYRPANVCTTESSPERARAVAELRKRPAVSEAFATSRIRETALGRISKMMRVSNHHHNSPGLVSSVPGLVPLADSSSSSSEPQKKILPPLPKSAFLTAP